MSRAIHITGKYESNGIGITVPLYNEQGTPGFIAQDTFTAGGSFPLCITPEQWHWFNFRVKEITSTVWSGAKFYFEDSSGIFLAPPTDETQLIKYPGAFYHKQTPAPDLTITDWSIGIPMVKFFGPHDISCYPVSNTSFPDLVNPPAWPLTFRSATVGNDAGYFTPNGIYPYIRFAKYANSSSQISTSQIDLPTNAAFGGFIELFDWGRIPYYAYRGGSPIVPENISIEVGSFWTYNGTYNLAGQPTGPIPLTM